MVHPGRDNIVKGHLAYNPTDGATLDVVGDYGWNLRNIDMMLGKTNDGSVTLLDIWRKRGEHCSETGISCVQYNPQYIFHGHLFEKEEDMVFDSVSFSLFNLLEWLNVNGLSESGNDEDAFKYLPGDEIEFTCYDGCKAKVTFYLWQDYSGGSFKTVLQQACKIALSYDKTHGFKDILGDIFVFVRFLTLSTYEQSYPLWIILKNSQILSPDACDSRVIAEPKEIRLIYRNAFFDVGHKNTHLGRHLIRYNDIATDFGRIMGEWFKLSAKLDPMIRLVVSPFMDKYDFSVEKFMDTMRAMETFHRRNHSNTVLPVEEFRARVEKACSECLTDEERNWMKEKLNFANEPTLKQRIAEMIRLYSFPYFAQRVKDTESFCKDVGNSRNYYTHFNPDLEKKALEGKALFDAMENIKLLLFAGVFKSIGIGSDVFGETIQGVIF